MGHELIFGIKPENHIIFNLSSTKGSLGKRKTSKTYPCHSFPNYTYIDNLGHHPQIKKFHKLFFAQ